jgi:hypothetical protein
MISQPNCSAISSASALLPEAVGPMSRMAGGRLAAFLPRSAMFSGEDNAVVGLSEEEVEAVAAFVQRPRMNIASSSASGSWNQVGRPWLH